MARRLMRGCCTPPPGKTPPEIVATFRRLLPYLAAERDLWWRYAAALALGLLYGLATGAAIPYLIREIMPVVFDRDGGATPGAVLFYCLLPLVVMSVRAGAGFGNTYLVSYCGQHLLEKLRCRVFETIQGLPLGYFQKQPPGELIARAMQDTQTLRDTLNQVAQDVIKQPVTMVAALGFLLTLTLQNAEAGYLLLFVLSVPLVLVPMRYFGKKVAQRAKAMLQQQAELTSRLSQNLGALYEIRAFNLQERESQRFRALGAEFTRRFLRVVVFSNLLSPAVEVVAAIAIAVALYYSWVGGIATETFVALILALYLCYEPVKKIGRLHAKLQEGIAALDRIEAVLDHPADLPEPAEPCVWEHPQGAICFENVTFSYGEEAVLRDVSVTIPAGQTVALVGPSGSGKTTFCNLIPRFYEPQQGRITVDGLDLRSLCSQQLREHLAIVPQDPVLFDESILENLRVGRLSASDEAVVRAACRAEADGFIRAFEQGYATPCGERGGRLSGGQRQRLALARAFLRDAPILILDEATSALDATSEALIQRAIEDLCRGRTVLIIAHRFSSIRHADRVLVFDQGRIVEDGTPEQLLAQGGLFSRLHQAQSLPTGS